MEYSAISHRSALTDCYALDKDTAVIQIRTGKDITGVNLIYEDPYAYGISGDIHWIGQSLPMTVRWELKYHLIWTARIKPPYKRLQYYFEVLCGDEKQILMEDDFYTPQTVDAQGRFKQYYKLPWMNPSDLITTPDWVQDTIWYQIMPDRFCRGDFAPKRMRQKDWDDRLSVSSNDFYGGDLRGIIQKLPYLKDLGITGIYLLPLFLSNSNHKYDTIDYTQIDPDFGTEADIRELVETAHALGIRVMLDAVFNHSGFDFAPWQDVWEKGEQSRYFDWFCINEKPFRQKRASLRDGRYYGFAFLDNMPKLNTNHPEVVEYFRNLCLYWVKNWDIDGIRFDVGNEISHTFLKTLHSALKAVKPDLFLLGEIWHDSVQWLQGDEYDSVMNYPFIESLQNFWVDPTVTAKELMYGMNRVYSLYPEQINRCIFNFLDTHDTMRALTRCGNPDVFYQQLAVLMTMPGTACIYYGTEIAMPGGHDPDCRRTMPWDAIARGDFDTEMQQAKALIGLRKTLPQTRGTEICWHEMPEFPRLVCYDRPGREETVRVFLNAGQKSVRLDNSDPVFFSRHYTDGELAPGGILIFTYRNV